MTSARTLGLAAVVTIGVAVSALAQSGPHVVSVYVFTPVADAAHPSTAEADRLAFVDQVKASLPDNSRISAQVAVVDKREDATITLEITAAVRQDRTTQLRSRNDVLISPLYLANATLTFGTYTRDFMAHEIQDSYKKTINKGRLNTPETLDRAVGQLMRFNTATKLSSQLREWIVINRAELFKK